MGTGRKISTVLSWLAIVALPFAVRAESKVDDASSAVATFSKASCKLTKDSFEPAVAVGKASPRYFDKCMDSKTFRAASLLSESSTELEFANLIHDSAYWKAKIPKSAAAYDKVFFQIQRFPVVKGVEAAHVQMRFRMKPGHEIEIESQDAAKKKTKLKSWIVSFEAGRPESESYNFALGAFNNYILVGRVASSEQRQFERSTTRTEQYELQLNPDEKMELAITAVKRSADRGYGVFYNTLKPNCTTELFDLLDSLPSMKGKFSTFLTVISPDPIAGPSLVALDDRKLLVGRVQDMNDEIAWATPKADEKLKTPSTGSLPELPFLPMIEDRPWTLVVARPPEGSLSRNEREALQELRERVLTKLPLFLQGLVSGFMLSDQKSENLQTLLAELLVQVQAEMKKELLGLDQKLSDEARMMGIYLVPMPKDLGAELRDLDQLGVAAALPFKVLDVDVDPEDSESQEILFHIAEGSRQAADRAVKIKSPAWIQALALRLQLQKGQSASTAQMMLGLAPLKKDFKMKNAQVAFSEVQIPTPKSRAFRSVLLISGRQEAQEALQERVSLDFGADGGIAGRLISSKFGEFQLMKGASCQLQAESVPNLIGEFAEAPLNNGILDPLLKGKGVSFGIFGAQMNLKTQKIEDMNIQVATWPLSCLSVDKVNSQFRDEANSMIQKYKEEADLDQLFENLLGKALAR